LQTSFLLTATMDFAGQAAAETVYHYLLYIFGVCSLGTSCDFLVSLFLIQIFGCFRAQALGFIVGFVEQSFYLSVKVGFAGFIIICLVYRSLLSLFLSLFIAFNSIGILILI
jgi:hypothetical protein